MDLSTQAFFWGIFSAISLPLGAALGLAWRPGSRISSTFMAFGAGALLFALSVELLSHVPHYVSEHGLPALAVAAGAAVAGGLLFDVLNQMLNNRGAFLRNVSNARNHIARTKRARARRMLRRLSRIDALREVPPEIMAELVKRVRKERYRDGELIFNSGDQAQEIHFIRRGDVDIYRGEGDNRSGELVATYGKDDTFGERAVLERTERRNAAVARGDVILYTLEKEDLRQAFQEMPELLKAVEAMASCRLRACEDTESNAERGAWEEQTGDRLDDINIDVTANEIQQERRDTSPTAAAGAALAIWLGIAIDGIPESLIIGTLSIDPEGVSLAFIAGVFLANMPEAMSSSISMRNSGSSKRRILVMWSSLTLLTGCGAFLGASLLPPDPEGYMFFVVLGIEALAAGAMLTMIAETMLPEAFEQGGSVVGMATLLGFLAALAVAAGGEI
ncbi:cyclic nucleotide-binding domain-containing protein [Proteobacteria bacterium 005FR1]|nr:cyclic nucleotide-binding domain-containing protein [Proteobacteria bacterium 005FR1]